jgi:hypothetical protein
MTEAVIVDVDGTLCDVRPIRHLLLPPKRDMNMFHSGSADMLPNQQALDFCVKHHLAGCVIVVVTARMYCWEDLTRAWLDQNIGVPYIGPFMRGNSDFRPDYEVKRDIHRILIEDHGYEIVAACDDNPNVIRLWEEHGIPVEVMPGWED